ncbi:ABC transporter substrate-binding protein [Agrococcus sediminis]|uniref:ABC transporter substrate-binding protein n=1 Tax=Agrococcus sediminis TaxID=2599924 RepID=A0A5M8QJ23_9MICO|nr:MULTISPECIES: ABC transporter substrate-binding protein [Agrococcus]KAA6436035.1 ABC transporter substrate-binding protein [Agrococcus sediminis]RWR24971.1 BMP family ABC transporter substrate-binding protein [Agrococcus lahaulensis]UOW01799.1 ABC transporter substrate-binding protein [Agrococcus sp. SCSIO52902]
MRFSKRTALVAGAATFALALAGCSGGGAPATSGEPEAGGDGETLQIALVSKGFQHQFWQAVRTGAEEAAEELGVEVTFEGPAAETEIDAQLQMLQAAIDRGPDAIGYAALDPQACIPLYEAAESAGIPIVEFDAGCESEYGQNLAATDSMAAGALAAQNMAELIGGEGQVGIVGHSQINSTGVERRDGFVEEIEANYPDIEIVDIQYGDGDHLRSADIAKAMIAAHPDLVGLYGTNEGSAIGIVNAVTELGLPAGELTIVGFDSGAAQVDAIRNGVMAGAITQDPIGIGRTVVENAVAAINGEELDDFTDTGSYWYDAENLEDPEIAAVLYE